MTLSLFFNWLKPTEKQHFEEVINHSVWWQSFEVSKSELKSHLQIPPQTRYVFFSNQLLFCFISRLSRRQHQYCPHNWAGRLIFVDCSSSSCESELLILVSQPYCKNRPNMLKRIKCEELHISWLSCFVLFVDHGGV